MLNGAQGLSYSGEKEIMAHASGVRTSELSECDQQPLDRNTLEKDDDDFFGGEPLFKLTPVSWQFPIFGRLY